MWTRIAKSVDRFLFYLEDHAYGILGTIIFHLVLACLFLIVRINALTGEQEMGIEIQFIPEFEEVVEEKKRETQSEFLESVRQQYAARNIPVNVSDLEKQIDIQRYIDEVKQDMAIGDHDPDEFERRLKEELQKNEIRRDDSPVRETRSNEVFSGPTRVMYDLPGRQHTRLPIPVYRCQGGGEITVEIWVNQKGYVLSTTIISQRTDIADGCLGEAAIQAARVTRFNEFYEAPTRQRGTITYHFVAQ